MLKPYYDKICIEPIKQETMLQADTNQFIEAGKVISIGRDVKFVKKGDLVYFSSWGVSKTPELDGKQYYVVSEHSDFILGKEINEPKKQM